MDDKKNWELITIRDLIACAGTEKGALYHGWAWEEGRLVSNKFWLPKSRITESKQYPVRDDAWSGVKLFTDVTMPHRFAVERGLVPPIDQIAAARSAALSRRRAGSRGSSTSGSAVGRIIHGGSPPRETGSSRSMNSS
jgi:hypothetical protein